MFYPPNKLIQIWQSDKALKISCKWEWSYWLWLIKGLSCEFILLDTRKSTLVRWPNECSAHRRSFSWSLQSEGTAVVYTGIYFYLFFTCALACLSQWPLLALQGPWPFLALSHMNSFRVFLSHHSTSAAYHGILT